MHQTIYLIMLFTVFSFGRASAQDNIFYIEKGVFTNLIGLSPTTHHGDDIVNINVFYKMGDKVDWGTAQTIISYRYLGVDSQNNLHLQREQIKDNASSDICNLTFALDANKSGDITLIGKRSQKEPLLIKIHVEADNNFIKTKFLGNLPLYKE